MSASSYNTKLAGYSDSIKQEWQPLVNSSYKSDFRLALQSLQQERGTNLIMAKLRFNEGTPYSRNLGQQIARYQDASSTQSYLALLTSLLTSNKVDPNEVLALLSSKDHDGWTLGDTIARYQDVESIQPYLALVTSLLKNDEVAPNEVVALLRSYGSTLGDFIASNHDNVTTQLYLDLLTSLLHKEEVPSSKVLALLAGKTNQYGSMGYKIACHQNAETTQSYLALVISLLDTKKLAPREVFDLLGCKNEWLFRYVWNFR